MIAAELSPFLRALTDQMELTIERDCFSLHYFYKGKSVKMIRGQSNDLYISLQPWRRYNAPQKTILNCTLVANTRNYRFGHHLYREEQEWLVEEISRFLKSIRQSQN